MNLFLIFKNRNLLIISYNKDGRQRQRVPIGANPQYNQKRRRTLLLGSKRVQV